MSRHEGMNQQGWHSAWRCCAVLVVVFFMTTHGALDAFARGGGRGGGFERGGASRPAPSGNFNRGGERMNLSGAQPARGNIGNANVNRNVDRNVNRNVDVHGGVVGRPLPPPVAVPVPVPVPAYGSGYYGGYNSGVAAGMVAGAFLTMLPATAIAISNSTNQKIYRVDTKCYREVYDHGNVVYQEMTCP